MNSYSETSRQRLYRDADRAVLGGVCAGLADYFGLNLKVTRFLAFIAFLTAMPFAIIAYLVAVCVIPSASYRQSEGGVVIESRCCWGSRRSRRRERRARRKQHRDDIPPMEETRPSRPTVQEVRERYKTLDKRLVELEKKVTSPRFQLEQEFRKL